LTASNFLRNLAGKLRKLFSWEIEEIFSWEIEEIGKLRKLDYYVLMSELGTGAQIVSAFRSGSAFASWLGLCPDIESAADASSKPKRGRSTTGSPTP
jgi:hypothetical protein